MYEKFSWAKKPPLKLVMEKVLLARRERGTDAQGDLLLQAALKALRSKHVSSARRNLKDFILLTNDLTPFQRALVENARSIAKRRWSLPMFTSLLKILPSLIELVLRLMSKKFPGCRRDQNESLAKYIWVESGFFSDRCKAAC